MKNYTLVIVLAFLLICVFILKSPFSNNKPIEKSSSPLLKFNEAPKQLITCKLTSDKNEYTLGEIPKFSVQITNVSNKTIILPIRIDGSVLHRRYPYCSFKIIPPSNKKLYSVDGVCGNLNRLHSENFINLINGESFNPFQKDEFDIINFGNGMGSSNLELNTKNFNNVGKYKICVFYSTDSNNIKDWLGDYEDDWVSKKNEETKKVELLFNSTPKLKITSNEITIEIVKKIDSND